MSMTRAISRTLSSDFPTSSMKVGKRVTGRLSRQKKPSSSRARTAVDFPEPERPVIISIRILFHLVAERTHFHARKEFLVELPGRMVPHTFKEEVPRGHLYDRREVAARPDRDL